MDADKKGEVIVHKEPFAEILHQYGDEMELMSRVTIDGDEILVEVWGENIGGVSIQLRWETIAEITKEAGIFEKIMSLFHGDIEREEGYDDAD